VPFVGREERLRLYCRSVSSPYEGGGDRPAQAQFSSESPCFFDPVRLRLESDL